MVQPLLSLLLRKAWPTLGVCLHRSGGLQITFFDIWFSFVFFFDRWNCDQQSPEQCSKNYCQRGVCFKLFSFFCVAPPRSFPVYWRILLLCKSPIKSQTATICLFFLDSSGPSVPHSLGSSLCSTLWLINVVFRQSIPSIIQLHFALYCSFNSEGKRPQHASDCFGLRYDPVWIDCSNLWNLHLQQSFAWSAPSQVNWEDCTFLSHEFTYNSNLNDCRKREKKQLTYQMLNCYERRKLLIITLLLIVLYIFRWKKLSIYSLQTWIQISGLTKKGKRKIEERLICHIRQSYIHCD